MLRVSKTLLCASAARVGLAVRQNVKVDKTGTLVNVVDKIGSLIQAQDANAAHSKAIDNIRMLAAITPEANDLLSQALTDVIQQIINDVDSMILTGFNDTQVAVDKMISDLDSATEEAVTEKKGADEDDDIWFQCIGVEQSKLEAVETANATEIQAISDSLPLCQLQEDSRDFTSDPNTNVFNPNPLAFTCNLNISTGCAAELAAYGWMVGNVSLNLKANAELATASWTSAKNACDAAVKLADEAAEAHLEAIQEWKDQKETCVQPHENRVTQLCQFGDALQIKCQKVDAYNDLILEVNGNGSEHSENDREVEWKTTTVTKCMLTKVIEEIDLDTTSLTSCENTVNYAVDVGTLDRKNSEFLALTSDEQFSCSEETITFNGGKTWDRPEYSAGSDLPASSSYVEIDFHPSFYTGEDTAAFSFCP